MGKKKRHRLKKGEHIRSVARRFGLASLVPLEEEPDNQALIEARGSIEHVRAGDRVTFPPVVPGKAEIATGAHHAFTIPYDLHTLEVRLYSEFRIADESTPGDKSKTRNRCHFFGQQGSHSGFFQIDARVELHEMDPGTGTYHVAHANLTRPRTAKGGLTDLLAASICELPAPRVDRPSFLRITPVRAEETSHGPARANPGHDRGLTGATWLPSGRMFESEYRRLDIDITTFNQQIHHAEIHGPPAPSRPHHATLFWKNVGERYGHMILEVDWRPDFLRRSKPSVKPLPKNRNRAIDMIVVHHTGGPEMGSQLNTFLNKKKGAHYVIDIDGHVVRVADDIHQVKHGGGAMARRMPNWDGRANINSRAIGIENCHGDENHLDMGQNPYSEAQYAALQDVIQSVREAYDISPRHVVGHQETSVAHSRCPGPHFDWTRLERAGQALAPSPLTDAETEAMFGSFFAGEEGRARRIELGDREKGGPSDWTLEKPNGEEITGLHAAPITELRQALVHIGYDPGRAFDDRSRNRHTLEGVMAYCLTQFINRFCTGPRVRQDLADAYEQYVASSLLLDFELARLLKGAEKAALLLA